MLYWWYLLSSIALTNQWRPFLFLADHLPGAVWLQNGPSPWMPQGHLRDHDQLLVSVHAYCFEPKSEMWGMQYHTRISLVCIHSQPELVNSAVVMGQEFSYMHTPVYSKDGTTCRLFASVVLKALSGSYVKIHSLMVAQDVVTGSSHQTCGNERTMKVYPSTCQCVCSHCK